MIYEPKEKGKKAQNLSLLLFFFAIVTVYLSNAVMGSMQWIMQSAAVILLGVFVYILVRWHFTGFRYEIKAKSKLEVVPLADAPAEKLQLYIHRRQGKRGYSAEFVCAVSDIEAVEPVGERKYAGKRFVFYRNMEKDDRFVLRIKGEDGPIFVFLEIDEEGRDFLKFINDKIAE